MAREALGKLNLRLPVDLRQRCQGLADLTGDSLNAVILKAIENYLPYAERGAQLEIKSRVKRQLEMAAAAELAKRIPKVAARQRCPCGSGKEYRRCHGVDPGA